MVKEENKRLKQLSLVRHPTAIQASKERATCQSSSRLCLLKGHTLALASAWVKGATSKMALCQFKSHKSHLRRTWRSIDAMLPNQPETLSWGTYIVIRTETRQVRPIINHLDWKVKVVLWSMTWPVSIITRRYWERQACMKGINSSCETVVLICDKVRPKLKSL